MSLILFTICPITQVSYESSWPEVSFYLPHKSLLLRPDDPTCSQVIKNQLQIINWNHLQRSLSIPLIYADMLFWQLCISNCQPHASMLLETLNKNYSWRRERNSETGLHFIKRDDFISDSNVCKMMISSKSGSTSNLLKHLFMQHGLKFQECHIFDTLTREWLLSNLAACLLPRVCCSIISVMQIFSLTLTKKTWQKTNAVHIFSQCIHLDDDSRQTVATADSQSGPTNIGFWGRYQH